MAGERFDETKIVLDERAVFCPVVFPDVQVCRFQFVVSLLLQGFVRIQR